MTDKELMQHLQRRVIEQADTIRQQRCEIEGLKVLIQDILEDKVGCDEQSL